MNWSRKRRNRKLPYPKGYVPLSEVFDATGREQFGELWDGREGAAEILESTSEQLLEQLRKMEAKSADPEEREQVEWERRHKQPGTIRLGPGLLNYQIRKQLDPDCEFGLRVLVEDDLVGFEELSPNEISERKRIRERVEWADKNPEEALEKAAASYKERYERRRRGEEIENSLRDAFRARRPVAYLFERATGNLLQVPPCKWHAEEFEVSFVNSQAKWKEVTITDTIERKGEIVLAEQDLKERLILPNREQEEGHAILAGEDDPGPGTDAEIDGTHDGAREAERDALDDVGQQKPQHDPALPDRKRGQGRKHRPYMDHLRILVTDEVNRLYEILGKDLHELCDAVYEFDIQTNFCNRRKLHDLFTPLLKRKGVDKPPPASTLQKAVKDILAELGEKP